MDLEAIYFNSLILQTSKSSNEMATWDLTAGSGQ